MRILNQSSVREHALLCSKQIKGGKFDRVSESFFVEVEAGLDEIVRSVNTKHPSKIHADILTPTRFVTDQLLEKLRPLLDRAVARVIQRAVESHPGVGKTLVGKFQ